jgi:hypothetical protein
MPRSTHQLNSLRRYASNLLDWIGARRRTSSMRCWMSPPVMDLMGRDPSPGRTFNAIALSTSCHREFPRLQRDVLHKPLSLLLLPLRSGQTAVKAQEDRGAFLEKLERCRLKFLNSFGWKGTNPLMEKLGSWALLRHVTLRAVGDRLKLDRPILTADRQRTPSQPFVDRGIALSDTRPRCL